MQRNAAQSSTGMFVELCVAGMCLDHFPCLQHYVSSAGSVMLTLVKYVRLGDADPSKTAANCAHCYVKHSKLAILAVLTLLVLQELRSRAQEALREDEGKWVEQERQLMERRVRHQVQVCSIAL